MLASQLVKGPPLIAFSNLDHKNGYMLGSIPTLDRDGGQGRGSGHAK